MHPLADVRVTHAPGKVAAPESEFLHAVLDQCLEGREVSVLLVHALSHFQAL